MTKNQSQFIRFLFFIVGIGILLLVFFLTKRDVELTSIDIFFWISIGIMYLVFSVPFFFSDINISNFSGKIPKMTILWAGILSYIGTSILVLRLLLTHVILLNSAIIIQSILLFIFAFIVYLAFFASSHARKVAAQETGKQQYINQMKPKAQTLLISINSLPSEHYNTQKSLVKTIEDIRFIYPVDNGAGDNLEQQIIRSLNLLSEYCSSILSGASVSNLESEALNLQMLVKERKLLRN